MSRKREKDPDWIDSESMTREEYYAALDKNYPRLSEPDEEGIDLNPADPRRRFIATCFGVTFTKAEPITEEQKAKAEAMWEKMTDGNYSPKIKKKDKK